MVYTLSPKMHGVVEFHEYLQVCNIVLFQKQGEAIPGEQIHELLNEIDTNRNGQVELDEYLQVRQRNLLWLISVVLQLFDIFISL